MSDKIAAVLIVGCAVLCLTMLGLTFDRMLADRARRDDCRLYGYCPSAFDACQYRGERCDEARAVLAGGARG